MKKKGVKILWTTSLIHTYMNISILWNTTRTFIHTYIHHCEKWYLSILTAADGRYKASEENHLPRTHTNPHEHIHSHTQLSFSSYTHTFTCGRGCQHLDIGPTTGLHILPAPKSNLRRSQRNCYDDDDETIRSSFLFLFDALRHVMNGNTCLNQTKSCSIWENHWLSIESYCIVYMKEVDKIQLVWKVAHIIFKR